MGTGTKCEHTGGGALQIGDLRLLEDGGELSGALSSDEIASETASEEQSRDGERSGVSQWALTRMQTLRGRWRTRAW